MKKSVIISISRYAKGIIISIYRQMETEGSFMTIGA